MIQRRVRENHNELKPWVLAEKSETSSLDEWFLSDILQSSKQERNE